ncbi:amidohydrolase [Aquabacterium sp. A7-Y]|nr:amidohydrolase [Aquabacterium sp. A7-Y]
MQIIESLRTHAEENIRLRRDIHAHPELGFEEHRTADIVARRLESWGVEVHRGVGGTGVVGVIRKGRSQRGVALRADMDALPVQELNRFAHASQSAGRMHACGHDGHTTTLLSAARVLAEEAQFDGQVVLVFQPAEETSGGARAMIRDGLFERFPVDAIFGFHNMVNLPIGHFAFRFGTGAALTNFKVTVEGRSAHAAMPHLGLDPVPAACQMVQAFQTVITRNMRPVDPGVISVTMIHAGETTNVLPSSCVLQGTVRCVGDDVLDRVKQRMAVIVQNTTAAFELSGSVEWSGYCPSVDNHAEETEFVRRLMTDLAGPENVHLRELSLGGEDFGYYLKLKPGSYFWIGNGAGQGAEDHRLEGHGPGPCTLHSASYDFNDALIPVGATFWVRLVERWLPAGEPIRAD